MMGRIRESGETDVFVHDVNKVVEDNFSNAFLCEWFIKKQEGRLKHFTIPSFRNNPHLLDGLFCPPLPLPS